MAKEGIQLEIYSYEDPSVKLGTIRGRINPQFLDERKAIGGGSFSVRPDDSQIISKPELIDGRNICKARVNGNVVAAFRLADEERITINDKEYAGQANQIAGEGLKTIFKDARIDPWGGLSPQSGETRYFNFSANEGAWYNPSDWIEPISTGWKVASRAWTYGPDKWPEGASQAYWVWGTAASNPSAPIGTCYFRLTLNVATPGSYVLYIAVDDNYSVFVDGEEKATYEGPIDGWKEAKRITFDLNAGAHVIGIRATNVRSAAGVIAALYRVQPRVAPVSVGTVTISIGVDAVFSRTAHGLTNGTKVYLTTTGALPVGLSPNKDYYVRDATANTFRLANSVGGPAIDTSGTQSGTHTILRQEIPESNNIVTYTGMSVSTLTSAVAAANSVVSARLSAYNALPAGNASGNNTQKKQAAAKATALAAYQKAVQDRNLLQKELNAANAMASNGITWKVLPYPEEPPGWTIGDIILTLMQEAIDRGVTSLSMLTPTFTGSVDSNGDPWEDKLDWSFRIGDKLYNVIEKAEELLCDIWVDPDTLELHAVKERGVDRSVYKYDVDGISVLESPIIFRRGKNLTQASSKRQSKIVNSLAIKTDQGWVSTPENDTVSISKYGLVEDTLDTGVSEAVSRTLAQVILKQRAQEEEGASYTVYLSSADKIPFVDFNVGDWVLAPDRNNLLVKRRIESISLTEGPAGEVLYTIEFDTIFRDNENRINKIIEKLGGGGAGGSYSNAGGVGTVSPTLPEVLPGSEDNLIQLIPREPTDLEAFSVGYWSANGVNPLSEVSLVWQPVTSNTDGSETVPQFYEVHSKATDDPLEAFTVIMRVGEPKATIPGFVPGTSYDFQVYAININGQRSIPSDPITHVMSGPTDPLPAPDTPTVSSSLGLLTVEWNGLLASDPPAPQFRYVYAEVSEDGSTGWTRKGPSLSRDGRQITIPNETVGEVRYVRLIAVDGAGIESEPSGIASTTITGVDLGDLDESIGEAIDAAKEAGIAAREQSNMLSDPSFELNTEEFWTLGSGVTNVTTSPRTGDRHLRLPATSAEREGFRYNRSMPCQPGDSFYFRVYIDPQTTVPENGLAIQVMYGATEALGTVDDVVPSGELDGTGYLTITGNWTVPAGVNFFKPRVWIYDDSNTSVYFVDDFRVLKMSSEVDIVAGSVTADKVAAGAIVAEHIQAGAIATEHIQAGAIVTEKIAADAVTANEIAAGSIESNHILAGAIETNHISPAVGEELNIAGNVTIIATQEQIAGVEGQIQDTQNNLEEMQTYYNFGPTGAIISAPGSVFATAVRNDRIEMLENGNVVSYWNSGTLYVNQFVGERVTLGNHQIEKFEDGTVVRAL